MKVRADNPINCVKSTLFILFFCFLFFSTQGLVASEVGLASQVAYCKSEMDVKSIFPVGNCFGENTIRSGNDRIGHFKISAKVDTIFRCTDVEESADNSAQGRLTETSRIEAIVHHKNGETCFFLSTEPWSTNIPDLDSCEPGSCLLADWYWNVPRPGEINEDCTACHRNGGPYFMHNTIDAMAHFGIVNNGHITDFGECDKPDKKCYRILHADPEGELALNKNIRKSDPYSVDYSTSREWTVNCGASCHSFVHAVITRSSAGEATIPSGVTNTMNGTTMPPSGRLSPYRWMNLDYQDGTGDYERYEKFLDRYGGSGYDACETPEYMEAHVVGNSQIIRSNSTYAKFRKFNPEDGLVCKNADMPSGDCDNYEARFQCGDGSWTKWQDNDSPGATGDHEYPPESCKNRKEIEIRFIIKGPTNGLKYHLVRGFPDRLHSFNNKELVCKNADQKDSECADYVVRFICPT